MGSPVGNPSDLLPFTDNQAYGTRFAQSASVGVGAQNKNKPLQEPLSNWLHSLPIDTLHS